MAIILNKNTRKFRNVKLLNQTADNHFIRYSDSDFKGAYSGEVLIDGNFKNSASSNGNYAVDASLLISEKIFRDDIIEEFTYDKGIVVNKNIIEKDGTSKAYAFFEDAQAKPRSMEIKDAEGKSTSKIEYDKDSKEVSKTEYEYENGRLSKTRIEEKDKVILIDEDERQKTVTTYYPGTQIPKQMDVYDLSAPQKDGLVNKETPVVSTSFARNGETKTSETLKQEDGSKVFKKYEEGKLSQQRHINAQGHITKEVNFSREKGTIEIIVNETGSPSDLRKFRVKKDISIDDAFNEIYGVNGPLDHTISINDKFEGLSQADIYAEQQAQKQQSNQPLNVTGISAAQAQNIVAKSKANPSKNFNPKETTVRVLGSKELKDSGLIETEFIRDSNNKKVGLTASSFSKRTEVDYSNSEPAVRKFIDRKKAFYKIEKSGFLGVRHDIKTREIFSSKEETKDKNGPFRRHRDLLDGPAIIDYDEDSSKIERVVNEQFIVNGRLVKQHIYDSQNRISETVYRSGNQLIVLSYDLNAELGGKEKKVPAIERRYTLGKEQLKGVMEFKEVWQRVDKKYPDATIYYDIASETVSYTKCTNPKDEIKYSTLKSFKESMAYNLERKDEIINDISNLRAQKSSDIQVDYHENGQIKSAVIGPNKAVKDSSMPLYVNFNEFGAITNEYFYHGMNMIGLKLYGDNGGLKHNFKKAEKIGVNYVDKKFDIDVKKLQAEIGIAKPEEYFSFYDDVNNELIVVNKKYLGLEFDSSFRNGMLDVTAPPEFAFTDKKIVDKFKFVAKEDGKTEIIHCSVNSKGEELEVIVPNINKLKIEAEKPKQLNQDTEVEVQEENKEPIKEEDKQFTNVNIDDALNNNEHAVDIDLAEGDSSSGKVEVSAVEEDEISYNPNDYSTLGKISEKEEEEEFER